MRKIVIVFFTLLFFLMSFFQSFTIRKLEAKSYVWIDVSGNLPDVKSRQINLIVIDPKNPNVIYAATGSGLFKSEDKGMHWNVIGMAFENVNYMAIDPKDSNVIYASATNLEKMYKTYDGGKNWVTMGTQNQLIGFNFLAINPQNTNILYASFLGYLYVSKDGGINWTSIKNGLPSMPEVNSILIDPKDPNLIYIGTSYGVFKSKDGGISWQQINNGLGNFVIKSLVFDPNNSNIIYAIGSSGTLYKTINGGENWFMVFSINARLTSIAINPQDTSLIYVGSDNGIYKNAYGNQNWISFNEGLTTYKITSLSIDPIDPNTIYAGTDKGIFKYVVSYIISTSTLGSGSISPSGTIYVPEKGSITFTFTPVDGNIIKDVLIDNKSVGSISSYTFDNVTEDHSIIVIFVPSYVNNIYNITASAGFGGTISPSGNISVKYGGFQTFIFNPNPGFKVADVKVDGNSIGAVSFYNFYNVTDNHKIEVSFEKSSDATKIILQVGSSYFTVNDNYRTLDSPPIVKNGRTILPIRPVVEELGGSVSWDPTQKKVTVSLGKTKIELWIGKNTAKVNGVSKPIDPTNSKVVPEIINGRTMVPLRFVAENLGCSVQWDDASKKITILSVSSVDPPSLFSKSIKYGDKTYDFDIIKINPKKLNVYAIASPNGFQTAVKYTEFAKIGSPLVMINGIPFDTTTHDLAGSVISNLNLYNIEAGTNECIGIDYEGKPFYKEGILTVTITTDKGITLQTYSVNQRSWGGFTIYTNWYKKDIQMTPGSILLKINRYGIVTQKIRASDYSSFNPSKLADGEFYIYAYDWGYEARGGTVSVFDETNALDITISIDGEVIWRLNAPCKLAIQSSPVVVKDGLPFRGEQRYPDSFRMQKYGPRAFLAFDKSGYFYFIVCKTAVSFVKDNVSEALAGLKIFDYVVSLDGGGSTTLYYNGKYLYTPGRDLVTMIAVGNP